MDDSLAIAWALPNEPYHGEAQRFMVDHAGAQLIAPPIYEMELDSLLRRSIYTKVMTVADAQTVLALLNSLPVKIVREPVVNGVELRQRAREIAELLEQPRVYDSTYAALAEAMGCDFWTAGEKFFQAAQSPAPKAPGRKASKAPRLPLVKFIGDY